MQFMSVFLTRKIIFEVILLKIKRIEALETEKILNFIPPTGSFILINYNINEMTFNLPFEVIHHLNITKKDVTLTMRVESRYVRGVSYNVDEFHVKLLIPK